MDLLKVGEYGYTTRDVVGLDDGIYDGLIEGGMKVRILEVDTENEVPAYRIEDKFGTKIYVALEDVVRG